MPQPTKDRVEVRAYLPPDLYTSVRRDGARYHESLSQTVIRLLSDAVQKDEAVEPSRRRSAQPA